MTNGPRKTPSLTVPTSWSVCPCGANSITHVSKEYDEIDKIVNDKEIGSANSVETENDKVMMIISEVFPQNCFLEKMDLRDVIPEKKKDDGPVKCEENTVAIKEETKAGNAKREIEKPRKETVFVSKDEKENSDNFNEKWNQLKSVSAKEGKYGYIRKRWGNTKTPDPSIDLTYRHRKCVLSVRGRRKEMINRSSKRRRSRSLSCVSHMEKLMIEVRVKYYSELNQLYQRQNLIMSEMQRHHQSECFDFLTYSMQNSYDSAGAAQLVLNKQRQDEELAYNRYQRQLQDLENKTNLQLARYAKYSEEILAFHKQYEGGRNGLLKSEQLLHLEETERMYKEYEKFYN